MSFISFRLEINNMFIIDMRFLFSGGEEEIIRRRFHTAGTRGRRGTLYDILSLGFLRTCRACVTDNFCKNDPHLVNKRAEPVNTFIWHLWRVRYIARMRARWIFEIWYPRADFCGGLYLSVGHLARRLRTENDTRQCYIHEIIHTMKFQNALEFSAYDSDYVNCKALSKLDANYIARN